MPRPLRVLTLYVVASSGLAACGAGPDPLNRPIEVWSLAPTPELRIGSIDAPGTSLTRIGQVLRSPSGEIFVSQPQERLIRVFTDRGEPVRTLGGRGDGPGEFAVLSRIGWRGDTLWAIDDVSRRLTLFTEDGDLLESTRLPDVRWLEPDARASFLALLPGRRLAAATQAGFGSALERSSHPFPVLVLPLGGKEGQADTVATRYTANDRAVLYSGDPSAGGSMGIFFQPFPDVTLVTPGPDGRSLILVDRRVPPEGAPGSYTVTKVGVSSAPDTVWTAVRSYSPVAADRTEQDSIVRAVAPPGQEEQVRSILFLPATLPPVTATVVAGDGSVWVAREAVRGAPERIWEIWAPEGRLVAQARIPAGLSVHAVEGSQVLGSERDELGVEYVVAYRVHLVP